MKSESGKNLEICAFARYVRLSPSKVRRVVNSVKGRTCIA